MEAKDKAKELVNKFKLDPIKPLCIMHYEHSKQCALIAVDEILLFLQIQIGFKDDKASEYFKKVKKEIIKL